MKVLIIINDGPYGTEKAYNAMRLAMTLQKEQNPGEMRIFLMADAVNCALTHQQTPQGYYNLERMLNAVISKGGKVKACGGCSEARGLIGKDLVEGVEISNMGELAAWVATSDKIISF